MFNEGKSGSEIGFDDTNTEANTISLVILQLNTDVICWDGSPGYVHVMAGRSIMSLPDPSRVIEAAGSV